MEMLVTLEIEKKSFCTFIPLYNTILNYNYLQNLKIIYNCYLNFIHTHAPTKQLYQYHLTEYGSIWK